MSSLERFAVWFEAFAREHHQLRASRLKAELRARRVAAPEEYLSGRIPPWPRPRFHVRAGDGVTEATKSRRAHRMTKKRPTGRPAYESDVYLAPKVFETMRNEGVSETDAIGRVTETLGQFDGWKDKQHPQYDVRWAAHKSARERVYRSLKRFREYDRPDQTTACFKNANDGWAITPEEAGRRAYEVIKAKYSS